MREVSLDEIREIAEDSKQDLDDNAYSVGLDTPKIILHWTAGWGNQCYDDYHINITTDGEIYVSTDDFSEILAHTWRLNTGTIGVAMCCCAGATTDDLGEEPPTDIQIEMTAQVIAVLCDALGLDINIHNVLTHGEAGDDTDLYESDELYGPNNGVERWDVQFLGTEESPYYTSDFTDPHTGGNVLRGKANYYLNQMVEK